MSCHVEKSSYYPQKSASNTVHPPTCVLLLLAAAAVVLPVPSGHEGLRDLLEQLVHEGVGAQTELRTQPVRVGHEEVQDGGSLLGSGDRGGLGDFCKPYDRQAHVGTQGELCQGMRTLMILSTCLSTTRFWMTKLA